MSLFDLLGFGQSAPGGVPAGAPGSNLAQLLGFNPAPPQTGVAGAQAPQSGGLMGLLGIDTTDPHNAMKLKMITNGLRTETGKAPTMFEGVQDAGLDAQQMQLRKQEADQQNAIREEERVRRKQLTEYAMSVVPANLQSLAQADPESALRLMGQMQPSGPSYGWEVINGQLVRTDSSGGATPMGQFGNQPRPMSPEDRAAWGIPETDTTPYYLSEDGTPKAVGGGGVIVNNGDNSNKFREEADKAAAARLGAYVEGGNSANQVMGDIEALKQLGTQLNTGKGAQITNALGPYAEALGVDIGGLGETQAYQAIISRMAPAMRPAGSGASSDTDVRLFLQSLPALGNSPEGNQLITETMQAVQEHKIAAAEISSQALSGEISWQDAEDQIRNLGDPYTRFKQYQQAKTADGSMPTAPAQQKSVGGRMYEKAADGQWYEVN